MVLHARRSLGCLDLRLVFLISSAHERQQVFRRKSSNLALFLVLLVIDFETAPSASERLEHADSGSVAALRGEMLTQLLEQHQLAAAGLRAGNEQPALDTLGEAVARWTLARQTNATHWARRTILVENATVAVCEAGRQAGQRQ